MSSRAGESSIFIFARYPKNDEKLPQHWTPGTPFGSLLAPKCDTMASELDFKKTIKKWHQKNHKHVAILDYTFARKSIILGHVWHLGSTWLLETEKLMIFVQKSTPNDQNERFQIPMKAIFCYFWHLDPTWTPTGLPSPTWSPVLSFGAWPGPAECA